MRVLRATRHFDQFPPTSLSVGCRIGQRTFAAPSPIGCRAPKNEPALAGGARITAYALLAGVVSGRA